MSLTFACLSLSHTDPPACTSFAFLPRSHPLLPSLTPLSHATKPTVSIMGLSAANKRRRAGSPGPLDNGSAMSGCERPHRLSASDVRDVAVAIHEAGAASRTDEIRSAVKRAMEEEAAKAGPVIIASVKDELLAHAQRQPSVSQVAAAMAGCTEASVKHARFCSRLRGPPRVAQDGVLRRYQAKADISSVSPFLLASMTLVASPSGNVGHVPNAADGDMPALLNGERVVERQFCVYKQAADTLTAIVRDGIELEGRAIFAVAECLRSIILEGSAAWRAPNLDQKTAEGFNKPGCWFLLLPRLSDRVQLNV